ncbi:hypothetical protein D1816_20675 [Aquimarina sp. AD10]|uniref:hypothetical protein n=1 Tax=Aquimarina sp. AD10 TaxID=1714849 RepID=UPI000E552BCA|nr:hypothetical protein [Aquimarina sp. AD10]AXT62655.1 hypothetical protein D1816_20675 [Aquimarina sp. AD10]RKM98349.1 hypothetical protein D7033_12980 [Aquimarina sp. AD10]
MKIHRAHKLLVLIAFVLIGLLSFGQEDFDFKKFESFSLKDTIYIDLNGNNIMEKVYIKESECRKLFIREEGSKPIFFGCGNKDGLDLLSEVEWVDQWCIVFDKQVKEVLFKEDGDIDKDTLFNLERPSIYIGKKETGGGIITYKEGELYWIHQAD